MTNYPPGVTGNEPQIRGMDEGVATVECHSYNAKLKVVPIIEWEYFQILINEVRRIQSEDEHYSIDDIARLDKSRKNILLKFDQLAKWLDQYSDEATTSWSDDCPFKGEVDVQYGDCVMHWICPICGQDHETEMEDLRP